MTRTDGGQEPFTSPAGKYAKESRSRFLDQSIHLSAKNAGNYQPCLGAFPSGIFEEGAMVSDHDSDDQRQFFIGHYNRGLLRAQVMTTGQ